MRLGLISVMSASCWEIICLELKMLCYSLNEPCQANLCLRAFRHDKFLTAHAQPFRGARDLAFCLKVPLDSLLVWASSEGSGETAWMRRLAWTFAARIGDKYQIRLMRSKYFLKLFNSFIFSAIKSASDIGCQINRILHFFFIFNSFLQEQIPCLFKVVMKLITIIQ